MNIDVVVHSSRVQYCNNCEVLHQCISVTHAASMINFYLDTVLFQYNCYCIDVYKIVNALYKRILMIVAWP